MAGMATAPKQGGAQTAFVVVGACHADVLLTMSSVRATARLVQTVRQPLPTVAVAAFAPVELLSVNWLTCTARAKAEQLGREHDPVCAVAVLLTVAPGAGSRLRCDSTSTTVGWLVFVATAAFVRGGAAAWLGCQDSR